MTTAYKPGDRLSYVGHTAACKEDCGAPCCEPGQGCPWEERIGKIGTVQDGIDGSGIVPLIFDGESQKVFIKFIAHISPEGGPKA